MGIRDVKKAYAAQMDLLWEQRGVLSKALKRPPDPAGARFDRVEISRQLSVLDQRYAAVKDTMERLLEQEAAVQNAQAAREQSSAEREQMKELLKTLEIYRRLSSGGEVSFADEERLMRYSGELYMTAKTLAILKKEQGKKHGSVHEEDETGEQKAQTSQTASAPPAAGGDAAAKPTQEHPLERV